MSSMHTPNVEYTDIGRVAESASITTDLTSKRCCLSFEMSMRSHDSEDAPEGIEITYFSTQATGRRTSHIVDGIDRRLLPFSIMRRRNRRGGGITFLSRGGIHHPSAAALPTPAIG